MYGSILKIDSTKKITKKLQSKAANSAAWCTNVGNERGEILISLLTTSESLSNLEKMADGLMKRYSSAKEINPVVLYTDRECCKLGDKSKYQRLFHQWSGLVVRLDSWHFMRRLSKACTNESHSLYGTLMSKISAAIFEWDHLDVELLRKAKRNELLFAGVKIPLSDTVTKAVTRIELPRHCKRKTQGTDATIVLIESLFLSLLNTTDSLGVPLLQAEAMDI